MNIYRLHIQPERHLIISPIFKLSPQQLQAIWLLLSGFDQMLNLYISYDKKAQKIYIKDLTYHNTGKHIDFKELYKGRSDISQIYNYIYIENTGFSQICVYIIYNFYTGNSDLYGMIDQLILPIKIRLKELPGEFTSIKVIGHVEYNKFYIKEIYYDKKSIFNKSDGEPIWVKMDDITKQKLYTDAIIQDETFKDYIELL